MSLNDDKWHHIALVRSGSILYLFIDGVIDNATNNTTNNSHLYIGQRGGGVNNFKGKIENVRLWETVLSNDEIKNDMHAEIPNLANLQATYNFNESVPYGNNSAITQVTDLNTSYHGTLHNFAKTGSSSNFTEGGYGVCK
ncbi:LamG domain-containing protein [Arcticibacterium luteifluviistationis]|uniref:LamG domain-containing protein n=1 Tax=Arcticibacterium luteifluviistationis TaxID=1784714 RepID=UPI0035B655BF